MNFGLMLPTNKTFLCVLKTREEMEKEIPVDLLGWWHDCVPGQKLELRQATAEDIAKCWIRHGASRNPENYMIELIDNGRLVLKKAIQEIKERP